MVGDELFAMVRLTSYLSLPTAILFRPLRLPRGHSFLAPFQKIWKVKHQYWQEAGGGKQKCN